MSSVYDFPNIWSMMDSHSDDWKIQTAKNLGIKGSSTPPAYLLSKTPAVGTKKPAVIRKKKKAARVKDVKAGFFSSSAEHAQTNTNIILSGGSSVEVTKEALLRAARDVKAGVAGATKADELGLQIAYTQWGKIIAHVSSDGHISLKEIEETVRLHAPNLRPEMVAYVSSELAKELNVASSGTYQIKTDGASVAAASLIPGSMKWTNVSKFALLPIIGVLLYLFVFKKK